MNSKNFRKQIFLASVIFSIILQGSPAHAKKPRPKSRNVAAAPAVARDAERWWSHVRFLADDKLEGRNTGSAGHGKAVAYVIEQFRRAGLKPLGTQRFLQPIKFRTRRILEDQSSLALVRDGKTEPLKLGDDATFNMRIEAAQTVEAPLVFAGYGLSIPEVKYDDFNGLDVRGKVVVYLSGGPPDVPGPLLSHYQSTAERWTLLKRLGAVGAVVIQNPKNTDIPWERSTLARLQPSMALADASLDDTAGQKLSVTINPARAERFFAGTPHTFKELLARADERKP
jgi:hypothetical protein